MRRGHDIVLAQGFDGDSIKNLRDVQALASRVTAGGNAELQFVKHDQRRDQGLTRQNGLTPSPPDSRPSKRYPETDCVDIRR